MTTTRSMARASAIDRLSVLPLHLLLEILSKVSYRDVIRTSLLSQRWRFLWKEMSHLNIIIEDSEEVGDDMIEVIISDALLRQSAPLHSFQLEYEWGDADSAVVNNWIRVAARKQVGQMSLQFLEPESDHCPISPDVAEFLSYSTELEDSVFECESLTALKLRSIRLSQIPTNFGGFHHLKTLRFYNCSSMDDDIFGQFIELCPQLQNLGISACKELMNLNIHASNLKYLEIGFFDSSISFSMSCPQLTEIKLEEFQSHNVGLKLLEGVSRAESVKRITLLNYSRYEIYTEIPSITVLNKFPQLEELTMHGWCFQEMTSDTLEMDTSSEEEMTSEEEMLVVGMTLPNLKKVNVHFKLKYGNEAVKFLGFLLRNCPINVMRVCLPRCGRKIIRDKLRGKIIRDKLLDMKTEFSKLRLSIVTRKWPSPFEEFCQFCDRFPEYF